MLEELKFNGWCEISSDSSTDKQLLDLASQIGRIYAHPNGNLIDQIIPKTKSQSTKNTFSYNYQLEAFPFHTDTAFWNLPARFVLLSNATSSNVATTIIHINQLLASLTDKEKNVMSNAIFLLKTPTANFYTKLLNKVNNKPFFRFDPNCMKAMNKDAMAATEIIKFKLEAISVNRITWERQKILIFDNWNTLHAREIIGCDRKRMLKRIYINEI
ncbi:TauD/TfdA family dioxygenase [Pedobacter gandavensis]|uniref:TauD/TfdA family dioxygenase n=1 Tax=Pedobacter gandavensis TaxID=2679963 RepID=UPI0029302ED9|nr:TauD/TfdA family dioxygenase [Pedobacter gandavensis]